MTKVLFDLRQAVRSLSSRTGSSLAVVLVLSVGVGLPTVIFALADPYVLRPLPFNAPDQLVLITVSSRGVSPGVVLPTFEDWQAKTELFQAVAAFTSGPALRIATDGGRVVLDRTLVTSNFLDVLGGDHGRFRRQLVPSTSDDDLSILVTPSGRALLPATVVAGTILRADEVRAVRVSGVLPDSFLFPDAANVLSVFTAGPILSLSASPDGLSWTTSSPLSFLARLQPGLTAQTVARALALPLPSGKHLDVTVEQLSDRLTQGVRRTALGALVAALLVWAMSVGNLANIFLAKRMYRTRELATRAALGASRVDLARLLITEVLVMCSAAVVLSILIASTVLNVSRMVIPVEYVSLGAPAITGRVVLFSLMAGLMAILLALAPASVIRIPAHWLSAGLQRGAGDRSARTLRFVFAVVQTSLSIVLAVGAALLVRSHLNLTRQDSGYDASALYANVTYPVTRRGALLEEDVVETLSRLRAVPGVQAAALTTGSVVQDAESKGSIVIEGQRQFIDITQVSSGFFQATGMSTVQGRELSSEDRDWRGVVINEKFAKVYLPGTPALGTVIAHGRAQGTIVGVVRDVLDQGLAGSSRPTIYAVWQPARGLMRYVLRVEGDPKGYRDAVRRTVAGVNRDAVIGEVDTIGNRLSESVRNQTFATLVLVCFCAGAGAVSVAGLFGIVAFVVVRRTREIAVRSALGAEPRHIRKLVAAEAISAALVGSVVGVAVSRWLSHGLEGLVFGVEAGNWSTALAAAGAALCIMVCASLVPAERAVRLEPTAAMRVE